MRVIANFSKKVSIDPLDVIDNLIEEVTHYRGWIKEDRGKYYRYWEESAGQHSFDQRKEITKEIFEYYTALKVIKSELEKK